MLWIKRNGLGEEGCWNIQQIESMIRNTGQCYTDTLCGVGGSWIVVVLVFESHYGNGMHRNIPK